MQSFFFCAHERCFNCLNEGARRLIRTVADESPRRRVAWGR
jgi:hypothetical protein